MLLLESSIINRLKAKVPNAKVFSIADVVTFADSQIVPALHVRHAGFNVLQTRPADKSASLIRQNWQIFVVVRNVRNSLTGEDSRAEASALANDVLTAMMGWKPDGFQVPFELTDSPPADYQPGFFSLPLQFSINFSVTNR